MICLYHDPNSGNCYKVRLLLAQLGRPHEEVVVDLLRDENYLSDYRRISMNRKVPLLRTEDGEHLSESGAILCYLADNSPFLPPSAAARLRVLEWLLYEQCSMPQSIKRLFGMLVFWDMPESEVPGLGEARLRAGQVLADMERHLGPRAFFVAEQYTIADIALYAYTHLAPAVGVDLAPYPAVEAWMSRVREQPGHTPFPDIRARSRQGTHTRYLLLRNGHPPGDER